MNYENEIMELKKRIEFLEGEENKRIAKRKREMIFNISKLVLVLVLIIGSYVFMYNTFIRPYREKVDFIEEKIDIVEEFVSDKWDTISKYNPFAS